MLEEYLAVQPAPEERIEFAVATLHATYLSAHLKPGSQSVNVMDLLPYLNPWKARQRAKRYSDVDRDLLSVLGD